MMTLVEIIEEKYKPVPIDPEIGGVNDIDSLEFSEQDKLESETDHPTRHQHHLARFGGSRADRLADAA